MIDFFTNLFHQYPEIFAGAVAAACAITFSELLRMFYFPKDWDVTDQWRAILPVDFFSTFAISHALWRFLDPADRPGLRLVGCICFGIAALGIHVFGLRFALHKWPWIAEVDPSIKPPDSKPS